MSSGLNIIWILSYTHHLRESCHFSAHSWGLEIILQFILCYFNILPLLRAGHYVQMDYFTEHSLLLEIVYEGQSSQEDDTKAEEH